MHHLTIGRDDSLQTRLIIGKCRTSSNYNCHFDGRSYIEGFAVITIILRANTIISPRHGNVALLRHHIGTEIGATATLVRNYNIRISIIIIIIIIIRMYITTTIRQHRHFAIIAKYRSLKLLLGLLVATATQHHSQCTYHKKN